MTERIQQYSPYDVDSEQVVLSADHSKLGSVQIHSNGRLPPSRLCPRPKRLLPTKGHTSYDIEQQVNQENSQNRPGSVLFVTNICIP